MRKRFYFPTELEGELAEVVSSLGLPERDVVKLALRLGLRQLRSLSFPSPDPLPTVRERVEVREPPPKVEEPERSATESPSIPPRNHADKEFLDSLLE